MSFNKKYTLKLLKKMYRIFLESAIMLGKIRKITDNKKYVDLKSQELSVKFSINLNILNRI